MTVGRAVLPAVDADAAFKRSLMKAGQQQVSPEPQPWQQPHACCYRHVRALPLCEPAQTREPAAMKLACSMRDVTALPQATANCKLTADQGVCNMRVDSCVVLCCSVAEHRAFPWRLCPHGPRAAADGARRGGGAAAGAVPAGRRDRHRQNRPRAAACGAGEQLPVMLITIVPQRSRVAEVVWMSGALPVGHRFRQTRHVVHGAFCTCEHASIRALRVR